MVQYTNGHYPEGDLFLQGRQGLNGIILFPEVTTLTTGDVQWCKGQICYISNVISTDWTFFVSELSYVLICCFRHANVT